MIKMDNNGQLWTSECPYKNKYGRCDIDDYNCLYKNKEKIEECKERKENGEHN